MRSLTADAVSFVEAVIAEAGERTTCGVDVSTYVTSRTTGVESQFRH